MFYYLGLAVFIGLVIRCYIKSRGDSEEAYIFGCHLMASIIFGIPLIMFVLCISWAINVSYGTLIDSSEQTKEIVSLSNGTESQGSFTLGCGSVNEVPYYYFFREIAEDTYKMDKVNADETVIKETTNRVPCLAWNETTRKVLLIFRTGIDTFDKVTYQEGDNILYVPKGTVIKEFAVR